MPGAAVRALLAHETRALLSRVDRVEPFALTMPMVAAAAPNAEAWQAVDLHLSRGRTALREMARSFLSWLESTEGHAAPSARAQARFTFLRLRFNAALSDLDVFADALSQRAEHGLGVRLAGLDALAMDALRGLPELTPPPLICYVDRGIGAAIRRARTRLPTGTHSPVAIIRVPRERMIGTGIGSSVAHEAGHQGAALLGLVESLRPTLKAIASAAGSASQAWTLWERWISEIVADLWAVSRLGVAAPLGLLAVIGLPRVFVFRLNVDDPHPMPWVRLHLSCAFGNALYPDPQWDALSRLWGELYPPTALSPALEETTRLLERTLPAFVRVVLEHRAATLGGRTLREVLHDPELAPGALRSRPRTLQVLEELRPCTALAHLGQARSDGVLAAEDEAELLGRLLTRWALTRAARPDGAENVVKLKAGAHARLWIEDLSHQTKEAAHG